MLCMRTAHTAQCTGRVPHCREENSSRQFHFKLRKIPISAKTVFSTGCCMPLQLLLPVQRSSMYCQQTVLLQGSIRVWVQWIHLSTSEKFIWGRGLPSIPRPGQQAQPGAGLPALCAVPDCPLPESTGYTACSSSAAGPFPPRANQSCQLQNVRINASSPQDIPSLVSQDSCHNAPSKENVPLQMFITSDLMLRSFSQPQTRTNTPKIYYILPSRVLSNCSWLIQQLNSTEQKHDNFASRIPKTHTVFHKDLDLKPERCIFKYVLIHMHGIICKGRFLLVERFCAKSQSLTSRILHHFL